MCEQRFINPLNTSTGSPLSQSSSYQTHRYNPTIQAIDNTTAGTTTTLYHSIRNDSLFQDENYTPIFGELICNEIIQFIKIIYIAKSYVIQDIENLTKDIHNQKNRYNFIKRFFMDFFEETSPLTYKLNEIIRIPDILDLEIHSLAYIFDVSYSAKVLK